jgi:predicted methyltransferase
MNLLRVLIVSFITVPALISNSYAINNNTETLIIDAISGEHRTKENKARDAYRNPNKTLLFFGIQKNIKVLEILPGRGWYTEILAPILKDNGQLTVASFGDKHPNDYLRDVHLKYIKHLNKNPMVYGNVRHIVFNKENHYLKEINPNSQDMVLTFRNTHNWIKYGGVENIYRAFHRVLKKGGVLGVVQHRAHNKDNAKETAKNGYVPESYLINLAEEIGFELIDKSEINANPKDDRNHPKGVWTLPPTLRLGETDKKKYIEIGESDRMTLKFIKL